MVSNERRESYLSKDATNVKIEWIDGNLQWNWIGILILENIQTK